jgi:hypothetical protein
VSGQQELIGSLQLLYWVYYSNWTEVSKLLQSLLPYKDHPDMKHAIKVCFAIRVVRASLKSARDLPVVLFDHFDRFRRP